MKKLAAVACAVGSIVLLSGCGGTTPTSGVPSAGSVDPGTSASANPGETETAAKDPSFVDGVLTTPNMKIVITRHKVIPVGKKGNEYGDKPVIAFWYKTTNLSGKKISPMEWLFVFTAYQDNNPNAMNELDVSSLPPDDAFLGTQTETIKKGGTVEDAVAYELDDQTTPVELVASDDLGFTEIGRKTYPVK